jgi:hypothetical protein
VSGFAVAIDDSPVGNQLGRDPCPVSQTETGKISKKNSEAMVDKRAIHEKD